MTTYVSEAGVLDTLFAQVGLTAEEGCIEHCPQNAFCEHPEHVADHDLTAN